jgi:hypothetical protein
MGRDWPCRCVKKIEDFDHGRDSGGPAVTLKWCSRWCSEKWSTTCAAGVAPLHGQARPCGAVQEPGTLDGPFGTPAAPAPR